MSEQPGDRVQDLFDQAVALPPAQRAAFLEGACMGDPALRAEVETLLACDSNFPEGEGDEGLLKSPLVRALAPMSSEAGEPPPGHLPGHPVRVGHYRILRRIAEGGMGTVYEAEQDSPRRPVALKVVRHGLASPALVKRFRHEAQILGRLHHPGIAQVYEAGIADDGQPFFAMEFIRGLPLDEYARRHGLDVTARLGLLAQVCDAVQHAHDQGVIHRDLKPANILVDEAGDSKVLDFGVARATDADLWTTSGGTEAGQLLGTVSYMSPEQVTADPAALDRRSDVYALGVILFELLANRLPCIVNDLPLLEMARVIREEEPPRLGSIDRRLRGDVETIVSQALAKDRARRYGSAGELASDIRRYLGHEPIRARRTTPAERLARWARRHPGLATALAVVALLLVTITAASIGLAVYFREQELFQRNLVQEKTDLASRNQELAEDNAAARRAAEDARQQAETTLVDMQTSRGLLAGERGNPPLALLWFATAAERAAADPQRRADNRLRARNWMGDAFLPVRASALGGHAFALGRNLGTVAFRPGGDLLLLRTDGKFFLWDWPRDRFLPWAAGTSPVNSGCWSPDGATLALGSHTGRVQICRVPDGKVLQELQHPGGVSALAFSPDGRYLALGSEQVRIWDVQAKRYLGAAWKHPATIDALAFNHAGNRLATACPDQKARLFAVSSGPPRPGPLFDPVPHLSDSAPVFIDGDHGLVTITGVAQLTCWDAERGQPRRDGVITTKAYGLSGLAASPHGDWFAVGGWSSAQVWKAGNPGSGSLVLEHTNRIEHQAFSSDGWTLLTAGWDQAARLWSLPEGRLIGPPLPHLGIVSRCDLALEHGYLATAQADGLVRVWQRPAADLAVSRPITNGARRLRVSANGLLASPGLWHEEPRGYAALGPEHLVVQEAATGNPAGPVIPLPGALVDSCICTDGSSVAAVSLAGSSGWLSVCEVATGRPVRADLALPGRPVSVDARPHSSQVAVLCKGGTLLVVEAGTGAERFAVRLEPWVGTENRWQRVEYTPDGATLVTLTDGAVNALHVREADTGRLRYPPIRPVLKGGPCRSFALSSDSRLLATAVTGTNAAQVWDLSSGHALSRPLLHPGDEYGLFHVSFSPDGRFLLTSHKDGQARVWDWKAGVLACPPLKHPDEVFAGWILPDGRHAVTACRGTSGTLHVWELRTGKPVATPLRLAPTTDENRVGAYVSLSPDGKSAYAIVPNLNSLTRLSLAELLSEPDLATEDLVLLGELASGRRIALGDESTLNSEEWLERWQRFRRRQPAFGHSPLDQHGSDPVRPMPHPGQP
jgi:serine/threonine protein kinase/WD40 repeat protein